MTEETTIEDLHAWEGNPEDTESAFLFNSGPTGQLCITTLEGAMMAQVGDWIIRSIAGEFYPCRDDSFRATYEEVSGG